jgi:tRNA1(Val) A37 N6-methylase TrmN6
MSGPLFQFKRFSLKNERSAMKVNTDGVLLGAAVELNPREGFRVLDAGTGTGVIALMVAQRLAETVKDFSVRGIDIDAPSAEEAAENFAASPWAGHMEAEKLPLRKCTGVYDLIVSNPPYYDDTLTNPDGRKNLARHAALAGSESAILWSPSAPATELAAGTGQPGGPDAAAAVNGRADGQDTAGSAADAENSPAAATPAEQAMSYRTLTAYAAEHLAEDGTLAMILPAACEKDVLRYAASFGLFPESLLHVCASEKKPPYRIVFQMKKRPSANAEGRTMNNIIKYKKSCGEYTPEYRALMKDFYLWA